jgi:hypothetical protein
LKEMPEYKLVLELIQLKKSKRLKWGCQCSIFR